MRLRPRSLAIGLLAALLATAALGSPAASHDDDDDGATVEIRKANEVRPALLQVAPGTTVRWVNEDGQTHRVRADSGTFDSGSLAKDRSFSFRFDQGGTYTYRVGTLSGENWSWWSGATITVSGPAATATTSPSAQPSPTASAPASTPTPVSSGASVTIRDDFFSPATLTVPVGTTVVWTNRGSQHTVTASGTFDSGVLRSSATFSHTFTAPGTYRYVCQLHNGMSGTIVVTGSAAPPSGAPTTSPPPTPTPTPTAMPMPPGGAMVHVLDNSFSPATLTVAVGTTVTWMQMGSSLHTVTSTSFDSGILRSGATFTYTFTSPGTYAYRCDLHSGMSGAIVVTGAATATSTSTPTSTSSPTLAPAPAAGSVQIEVGDNTFGPQTVTAPVGTRIVFANRGQVMHTATADDGSFDTGLIRAGATGEITVTRPGRIAYHCELHSGMTGTIIVTGEALAPTAAVPTPTPGPAPTPRPNALPAGGLSIVIGDNVFNPGTTRVPMGATVSWVNHGRIRHTVTSTSSVFDSGLLSPDGIFSVKFDKPGRFPYICDLHPTMRGLIEVYGPDGVAPAAEPTATAAPASAAAITPPASAAHVMIGDDAFRAKEIRVSAGTEVSWLNHGAAKHTVTFIEAGFGSSLLGTGQSWSHTFDKPGTYKYICALHPEMTGTVVVTEAVAVAAESGGSSTRTSASTAPSPSAPAGGGVGWPIAMVMGTVLGLMLALVVGGPLVLALSGPSNRGTVA
jgi:plastocyanin